LKERKGLNIEDAERTEKSLEEGGLPRVSQVWQAKELERIEERSFDSLRSLRMTTLVG